MPPRVFIECCKALVALHVDDDHVPLDANGKPTGPAESLRYGECPNCGHRYYNVLASHAPGTEFPPTTIKRRVHNLVEYRVVVGMPDRPISNEEADRMLAITKKAIDALHHELAHAAWAAGQNADGFPLTIETVDD